MNEKMGNMLNHFIADLKKKSQPVLAAVSKVKKKNFSFTKSLFYVILRLFYLSGPFCLCTEAPVFNKVLLFLENFLYI